jgi:hypothetical protein
VGYFGKVYTYTYSDSSSWTKELILNTEIYLKAIHLSKIKSDSLNRLYVGGEAVKNDTAFGIILEITRHDSSWAIDTLPYTQSSIAVLRSGDAKNTEQKRLYASTWGYATTSGITDTTLYEFYWDSSWEMSPLPSQGSSVFGLTIGDARNDGLNRLYCTRIDPNRVEEYSWDISNNVWEKEIIGNSGYMPYGIIITQPNGVDSNWIFFTGWDKLLYGFAESPFSAVAVSGVSHQNEIQSFYLNVCANPISKHVIINLNIPDKELVKIQLLNASGQQIKAFNSVPSGNRIVWDGKNDTGNIIPNGLYIVCVFDEQTSYFKPFIFIR